VYKLADATPPALAWLPSNRWKPGQVVRITTLPLTLPRVWGVLVSQAPEAAAASHTTPSTDDTVGLAAIYQRTKRDQLVQLASRLLDEDVVNDALRKTPVREIGKTEGVFKLAQNQTMKVTGWLPAHAWPGQPLDVWLQWQGVAPWPQNLTPFIHLRQQNTNLAQSDGLPLYFVHYPLTARADQQKFTDDWRQLTIPANAQPATELSVVIGLYNPQTGQRAEVVDANGAVSGNELTIGHVHVDAPFMPDQACALIPQTCASQPFP
jgi:hypothetical protein